MFCSDPIEDSGSTVKFLYISETSTCDHLPSSQHPNSSSFNVAPALRAGAVAGGEGMGVAVLRAVVFPMAKLRCLGD